MITEFSVIHSDVTYENLLKALEFRDEEVLCVYQFGKGKREKRKKISNEMKKRKLAKSLITKIIHNKRKIIHFFFQVQGCLK